MSWYTNPIYHNLERANFAIPLTINTFPMIQGCLEISMIVHHLSREYQQNIFCLVPIVSFKAYFGARNSVSNVKVLKFGCFLENKLINAVFLGTMYTVPTSKATCHLHDHNQHTFPDLLPSLWALEHSNDGYQKLVLISSSGLSSRLTSISGVSYIAN